MRFFVSAKVDQFIKPFRLLLVTYFCLRFAFFARSELNLKFRLSFVKIGGKFFVCNEMQNLMDFKLLFLGPSEIF